MLLYLPTVIVFLIAAALGALLAHRIRSLSVATAVALVSIVVLELIVARLPFCGLVSEMTICPIASILAAPAFTPLWLLQKRYAGRDRSSVTMREAIPAILLIPILLPLIGPGVLMTVGDRWRYASDVRWEADGRVIEKYLSWNHQALTLVAQSENGHRQKLEGVEAKFFAAASIGDSLKKEAGHTRATLNGVSLPIVRPRVAMFGIPQASAPD